MSEHRDPWRGDKSDEQIIDEAARHLAPRFHQHLDECERCRENPAFLCPIGAHLLTVEVGAIDVGEQRHGNDEPV